jgi:hypothetical protein
VVSKRGNKKKKVIKLIAINLESKFNLRGDRLTWLFIKTINKDKLIKEVDYNYILLD